MGCVRSVGRAAAPACVHCDMTIWDTVVVGAGPTGCLVAERLAARRRRVIVVDAGKRPRDGERPVETDRHLWAYRTSGGSYDWYRVRAVGGRTLLWGGWSHRFPEETLQRAGWPYGSHVLAPLYAELEARLGVVEGVLDERYARVGRELEVHIVPKRAPMLDHGRVWTALQTKVARRVRTLAAVLGLEHTRGAATAARFLDLRDGATKRFRARSFVLAASPIETTRILLESELGRAAKLIGRGFVDHMVASYVLLEPAPPPRADGRGRFPGSALVESFVNTGSADRRPYRGGFSIEVAGPVPLETLGIERMVPSAELERWSATLIHALGETFPHRRRFVDLDRNCRDSLARPVPRIHVAWSREERSLAADMRRACVRFADALGIPGSRLISFVDPLLAGAGHEAGTASMGLDPRHPCDPWGRLRALDNVWIADASVMPTAGDRHPTLTLLAHSLRAADSVAAYLTESGPLRRGACRLPDHETW